MIPAAFEYHAPTTIGEATALLARLGEDAKVLSGGQSLIPLMKLRLANPAHVVDSTKALAVPGVLAVITGEDLAKYVSLVASRRRAAMILERLKQRGAQADRLGRLKAPAGLDIGAVTPEEIAVSILAEIIQHRRSEKAVGAEAEPAPALSVRIESKDPICGMIVDGATAKFRSEFSGRTVYFCCRHCKEMFDQDPERYPAVV